MTRTFIHTLLCGRDALDAISTGAAIAFAVECFEHGLIGLEDTDGIELRFGDAEAMLKMIAEIARREGMGNLLAEGTRRATRALGREAAQFVPAKIASL